MCSYSLAGQGKNRFPVCKRNMFLGGPHFCSLPSSVFHMDTLLNVAVTCMLSCFSCVQLFATPWTITHQIPLSIKLPGKNTGVGCHFLLQEIFPSQGSNPHLLHWQADSLPLTLWTVAHQAPLSMGFSRQEYWNGLPFFSPGDLPNPGIEPRSPALQADSLPLSCQGSPLKKKIRL